jgi:hypothetical protein
MKNKGARRRSGWLMRSLAITAATLMTIGLGLAGTAQAQPAVHARSADGALHSAARAATTSSEECFYTVPDCSSTDPSVKFSIVSVGDSTGCSFSTTVDWGDNTSTTMSFPGGPNESTVVRFTHTYSDVPQTYTITITTPTTAGGCNLYNGTLDFTLESGSACGGSGTQADVPGSTGQCSYCPAPPESSARGTQIQSPPIPYFWATAYTQDTTANYAAGTFRVEDPTVVSGDCHSLAELSVSSAPTINTGFNVAPNNTIEVGWTVDPSISGQTGGIGPHLPHLFVYYWVNGAKGCYDTSCPGFQKVGNLVGSVLPVGSEQTLSIEYAKGDWDIFDGDELIGFYPGSLWSKGYTEFHTAQWFGEVAAAPGATVTCTDMGNGDFPTDPDADTITALTLRNGDRVLKPSVFTQNLTPNYYDAEKTSADSIRFGGNGKCSPFA